MHVKSMALHEVTWCMYVVHTGGSSFMWHQQCQRCKYTTSVDIQNSLIYIHTYTHSCRITHERGESSRQRRIALYKSDQQQLYNNTGWLTNWWLAGWLVGWLAGWVLTDWLDTRLVNISEWDSMRAGLHVPRVRVVLACLFLFFFSSPRLISRNLITGFAALHVMCQGLVEGLNYFIWKRHACSLWDDRDTEKDHLFCLIVRQQRQRKRQLIIIIDCLWRPIS